MGTEYSVSGWVWRGLVRAKFFLVGTGEGLTITANCHEICDDGRARPCQGMPLTWPPWRLPRRYWSFFDHRHDHPPRPPEWSHRSNRNMLRKNRLRRFRTAVTAGTGCARNGLGGSVRSVPDRECSPLASRHHQGTGGLPCARTESPRAGSAGPVSAIGGCLAARTSPATLFANDPTNDAALASASLARVEGEGAAAPSRRGRQ